MYLNFGYDIKLASTTTAATLAPGVSLSYFHRLVVIILSTISWLSIRLVHRVLFISNSDSAFIITQIIHAPINIIINHLTSLQKGLFYIKSCFGWGFQENQSIFLSKTFTLFGTDLSSTVQVCFISYQHYHNVWIAILPYFFKPPCQMVKRLLPSNIID